MPQSSIILDALTPFMLEHGVARGRVVRLSGAVQTILSRHDYPPVVAQLLGELLLVGSMLAANLKHDGILTIQLRGKGAVTLAVVDVMGTELRGCAEIDPEKRATLVDGLTPQEMMGEGAYLAIMLDPGMELQRYQGIVALEGNTIAEALLAYFTRSQQIEVYLKLAVEKDANGYWQAGGFMLERVAEGGGIALDAPGDDHWVTAVALSSTLNADELLDPLLVGDALLYRLFHEDGVWVYAPHLLTVGCRCSRERIVDVLTSMPLDNRADMVVDGHIGVHCQFCNRTETFAPQEVGLSVN